MFRYIPLRGLRVGLEEKKLLRCPRVVRGVAGVPPPAVLGQISDHPAFTELTDFIVRMKSSGEDDLEITNL